MGKHARLSPSNHRWPKCAGSVREESKYPDVNSDASVDGTGSHLLLELSLRGQHTPDQFIGETIGIGHDDKPDGWLIDAARADRVKIATDYIYQRVKDLGDYTRLETESLSNPGYFFSRQDWWGTADVTLMSEDNSTIEVIDYKDGFTYVSEKDNPQMIAYGMGKLFPFVLDRAGAFYADSTVKQVKLTIIQPKTSNPIRSVTYTPAQLWKESLKLLDAAQATDDPNAPLTPGEWCRWCKHKPNCKEKLSHEMKGFDMVDVNSNTIAAVEVGSIKEMTPDQLAQILDAREPLKKVIKVIEAAEAEALSRLENDPTSIQGYTISKGRATNQWAQAEEITAKKLKGLRFTKSEMYPPKFVTPSQALKNPKLTARQKERIKSELMSVIYKSPKVVPANEKLDAKTIFAEVPMEPVESVVKNQTPVEENLQDNFNFL